MEKKNGKDQIRRRRGHLRLPHGIIDNGLLGKIVQDCGTASAALVWVILYRYTRGFHEEMRQVTEDLIAERTGLTIRSVRRAVRALECKGFLKVYEASGQANLYEIIYDEPRT